MHSFDFAQEIPKFRFAPFRCYPTALEGLGGGGKGHTRRSYAKVIRKGHTRKKTIVFRYIAIRGSCAKPYAEVIHGGHTWGCFLIAFGSTAEAIRKGHTRRPYAQVFLDKVFLI